MKRASKLRGSPLKRLDTEFNANDLRVYSLGLFSSSSEGSSYLLPGLK